MLCVCANCPHRHDGKAEVHVRREGRHPVERARKGTRLAVALPRRLEHVRWLLVRHEFPFVDRRTAGVERACVLLHELGSRRLSRQARVRMRVVCVSLLFERAHTPANGHGGPYHIDRCLAWPLYVACSLRRSSRPPLWGRVCADEKSKTRERGVCGAYVHPSSREAM